MTRQQEWSRRALECVGRHKGVGESEYRTLCMKMPALVHQSGLVQALAFIRARHGDAGKAFCSDLTSTLSGLGDPSGRQLLDEAQAAGIELYLALTRDVLEVSVWFRRFAQSELDTAEGEA